MRPRHVVKPSDQRPESPGTATATLADWLDEYRSFPTDAVVRTEAEPEDDWQEPELLASPDRVADPSPRWMERARRVGYGRPTQI